MRLDLVGRSAEPGRMSVRVARERQIARRGRSPGCAALFRVHAAHQPVDAESARKRNRPQFILAGSRHDLHPDRRAGEANDAGQTLQHRGVRADVLEADMLEPERTRDLDEGERVLDRRVVARQRASRPVSLWINVSLGS